MCKQWRSSQVCSNLVRVRHSQGPSLPAFATPRVSHCIRYPNIPPTYPVFQIPTRIALHENRSWIDENNSLVKMKKIVVFPRGGDLGGTGGTVPQKFEVGDGPCIGPPIF